MSHFKDIMHQIRFPASVRPSVCLWSTSRSDVDTAWRRRSWWTLLVCWGRSCLCPFDSYDRVWHITLLLSVWLVRCVK